MQNLRILVCQRCYDTPQEQLRTIVLPPDPVPINNPRPEQYVPDSNPNSPIGQSANTTNPFGTNIGNLNQGAGTWAAFDGNTIKPRDLCAGLAVSAAGFNNWVGKNWSAEPSNFPGFSDPGQGLPQSITGLSTSVYEYIAEGFTAVAPIDSAFFGSSKATNWKFQGSSDGATWTDLASGTTTGAAGETISATIASGALYQGHRLVFNGNNVDPIAVAQLSIDTANRGTGGIPGV